MAIHTTELFLMHGATQQAFIDRVEQRGKSVERAALVSAWREARAAFARLEENEAGCADEPAVLDLPREMESHARTLAGLAVVTESNANVPWNLAMIELDAVMCSRNVLYEEVLAAYKARLPEDISDERLVAQCLPLEDTRSFDTRIAFDGHAVSVTTDDDDLHWPTGALLTGESLSQISGPGGAEAALQHRLVRPAPLVHAVRLNGRLLLVNGHHRARVLRAAGQTYAPCLVSHCVDLDDVRTAAPALANADLGWYFNAPRPPMLRDFDRPGLVYRYRARRLRRLLRLRVDVTSQWLP